MQQIPSDLPDPDNLPAREEDRRVTALTIARNNQRALSLDLITGQDAGRGVRLVDAAGGAAENDERAGEESGGHRGHLT